MTPREKHGDEFLFHRFTVPHRDGHMVTCREVCVCIGPQNDKESTLAYAWQIVRELAEWLIESFDSVPDQEPFRIIVAWSRSVRIQQGHIFKIWGHKEEIRKAAASATFQEFADAVGGIRLPMSRWEKDVFEKTA